MFSNELRYQLESCLANILPDMPPYKSSKLLRAYATFGAIEQIIMQSHCSLSTAYNTAKRLHQDLYGHLFLEMPPQKIRHAYEMFLSFSVRSFLKYVVTDLVCDVDGFLHLFSEKFDNRDLFLLTEHILKIKLVSYHSFTDADNKIDPIHRLYQQYQILEPRSDLQLAQKDFCAFYRVINQFDLNQKETDIPCVGYKKDSLHTVIASLSRLGFSRQEQATVLAKFYVENGPVNIKQLLLEMPCSRFAAEKSPVARERIFRNALKLAGKIPPLDLACSLWLYKKSDLSMGQPQNNDIPLENGLIYSRFVSLHFSDDDHIAIFFPSPFFVRKYIKDIRTGQIRKTKVTFIFRDRSMCELVSVHYQKFEPVQSDTIDFVYWDAWKSTPQQSNFTKLLLFAYRLTRSEQNNLFAILKEQIVPPFELLATTASWESGHPLSPLTDVLKTEYFLDWIALIPQGINNSTQPRRKQFLHAYYHPLSSSDRITPTENITKLYAYTLNTDLKTQALSLSHEKPVEVAQRILIVSDSSIRQLYQDELINRRSTGRIRTAPCSYQFTPDITIWYSQSYSNQKSGYPILEAYLCEPPPPGETEHGCVSRGPQIPLSKKRVTHVKNTEIQTWLETEYPFSVRIPRTNAKKSPIKTLEPIDIRQVAISKFSPYLSQKNIALKTFWYLHPELESRMSSKSYNMFSDMVKGDLGQLRVNNISVELVETLLEETYPNDSYEVLWSRINILSAVLTIAVEYGYCESNNLQRVLQDRRQRNKLFAQVRRALTKKHFTESELLHAYTIISEKLAMGYPEYLGVLIRLLTGLESNIVCALRWMDWNYISAYHFSRLLISRQVSNDGKCYTGFSAPENYISFPCMNTLQVHLANRLENVKQSCSRYTDYSKFPIITTAEQLSDETLRFSAFPPQSLDLLTRDVLQSVGIDDHIIQIPDKNGSMKETNLNVYFGDFFRENFRFWASSVAKLSNDEVLYLLRNHPETTFGTYYCDFLNETSQWMLYAKLQRWDALFNAHPPSFSFQKQVELTKQFSESIPATGSAPLQIQGILSVSDISGTVQLFVDSQFGVSTYFSLLQ